MSRRPTTPAVRRPEFPQEGGSFIRQRDGSLRRADAPDDPPADARTTGQVPQDLAEQEG